MWGVPVPELPSGTSQQKQDPKIIHGEEHTRGSPSLRPLCVFSHPWFSLSIYAVGALVFRAERKCRKLRHHTQEVENSSSSQPELR